MPACSYLGRGRGRQVAHLVDTYIYAFREENVCTKVCRLQSSTHSLVHLPHVSAVVNVWDGRDAPATRVIAICRDTDIKVSAYCD